MARPRAGDLGRFLGGPLAFGHGGRCLGVGRACRGLCSIDRFRSVRLYGRGHRSFESTPSWTANEQEVCQKLPQQKWGGKRGGERRTMVTRLRRSNLSSHSTTSRRISPPRDWKETGILLWGEERMGRTWSARLFGGMDDIYPPRNVFNLQFILPRGVTSTLLCHTFCFALSSFRSIPFSHRRIRGNRELRKYRERDAIRQRERERESISEHGSVTVDFDRGPSGLGTLLLRNLTTPFPCRALKNLS